MELISSKRENHNAKLKARNYQQRFLAGLLERPRANPIFLLSVVRIYKEDSQIDERWKL